MTYTLNNLPEVAGKVLSDTTNKTLLFYGEMGVGKTTLIKELAKKLGVTDMISSPTFSIVNEYRLDDDRLYHFDFYRLNTEEEALDIGVEDYFYSGHWNFIEWPEKVKNLLPLESTKINITTNKNGSRTINIMPVS
tara:strand:+ start:1309 stop:1716 length:408 start_codon:yes stop_codon:yes gene_type:complete